MKSVAVFVNEASTILLVIDPFHTVAVLESVAEDPAPHNRNRLLPHKVLSHLQLVIGIADIQFRLHVLNWLFKRGDGLTCEEQERERGSMVPQHQCPSWLAALGKKEGEKQYEVQTFTTTSLRTRWVVACWLLLLLCVCVCGGEERSLVYQCIFFFYKAGNECQSESLLVWRSMVPSDMIR